MEAKQQNTDIEPITTEGLYIVLISVHGLTRGHDLELGRDADTGGQIKYVVELARALAQNEKVARVDLLTRMVIDPKVSDDYAQPYERLDDKAYIVRLQCGPRRYLRKEVLWPYLDGFADRALQHIRRVGRVPDIIHSHYADAGHAGARLASLLGVPLIYTGHSLGRVKHQRLIHQGVKPEVIESQYHISRRIEAEEVALDNAVLVIASTSQEVDEQYSLYDNYQPRRMSVIPPGIDLERFYPPKRSARDKPPIYHELARFLRQPDKPMILAMSRPDARKNIGSLIKAYGESERLRELANLVIVAGNRDDIQSFEKGPRTVLTEMLQLIDYYDLYGSAAYPKHHGADDVPALYRLASRTRGVFVNPALTEPFGLTLIEAAATGLPIIATEDGGPRDIIAHCENGVLIDPLDVERLSEVMEHSLADREQWRQWSKNGLRGVKAHYSWPSHVKKYLQGMRKVVGKGHKARLVPQARSRLPTVDRILVCDVDNTLLGDMDGLRELLQRLRKADHHIGFAVASGRNIDSTLKVLKEWGVPVPDILITAVGTEIHYGHGMVCDEVWQKHIDHRWEPGPLREAMKDFPGLKLQPKDDQREHKISYYLGSDAPSRREVVRHLRKLDLHANVIYSHQSYLDLLPIRASKGLALRHIGMKWGLLPERFLVAGDSGNDEEMLSGYTLGVVVGNHSQELERLRGQEWIYFADGNYAWGILEGIDYYDFFGDMQFIEEADKEYDGLSRSA